MSFLSSIVGHPAERGVVSDQLGVHTYGDIVLQARHLAATLKDLSIVSREPIAYLADKSSNAVIAMLGIWFADAIAVPFSPEIGADTLRQQMKVVNGRFIVGSAQQLEGGQLHTVLKEFHWVATEMQHSSPLPLQLSSNDRDAIIVFADNSTFEPPPIVITFSALAARAKTLVKAWQLAPNDPVLHLLPMGCARGIVGLLATMAAGAMCKYQSRHRGFSHALANEPSALILMDATDYGCFIDAWEALSTSMAGKQHAKLAIVSLSPEKDNISEQWCQLAGITQYLVYARPEGGILLCMDISEQCPAVFSGYPVEGVSLRLVNDGDKAEHSQAGLLEVRSPQLFSAYFQEESRTSHALNHGWFRTGLQFQAMAEGGYTLIPPIIDKALTNQKGKDFR